MKKESKLQAELIKELKTRFSDCVVMKTNPNYIQGIPDLLILSGKNWAALECKRTSNSSKRPNQPYYIRKLNDMSFARFISPENKEVVLHF